MRICFIRDSVNHILNDSQMNAVEASLTQKITLIQGNDFSTSYSPSGMVWNLEISRLTSPLGPPGTGKTTTAVGILNVLSRVLPIAMAGYQDLSQS
jgi:hypothetical protein